MPLHQGGDASILPETRATWIDRHYATLIGLLIVGTLAARVWRIDYQSLSNDEIIEIEDARLGFAQILHSPDGFPPLFRLLVSLALACWDSPLVGRWLSVGCGVLTVLISVALTHRLAGRAAAVIAGVVTGLSPFLIHYAQEARPYSLFVLCGTAACYSLHRALNAGSKSDWACFVISSTLGVYTHYYMSLIVVAAGIAWLHDRIWTKAGGGGGLTAFSAVALLCLPLYGLLRDDFEFTEGYPVEVSANALAVGYTYFSFLSGYAFGPSVSELHELVAVPRQAVRAMLPAMVGSATLLALPMLFGFWRQLRERRDFVVMLSFAVTPVLCCAALSAVFELNFNVRYAAPAAVPCLVMVAVGICGTQQRWLRVPLLIACTAWLTLGAIRRQTVERYFNEDVRSAANWLEHHAQDQNVFVISDYMARTLAFYSDPQIRVHRFPDPNSVMWIIRDEGDLALALQMVQEQSSGRAGCWMVVTRAFHCDPNRLLRNWLSHDASRQIAVTFPGVEVWHWAFTSGGADGLHLRPNHSVTVGPDGAGQSIKRIGSGPQVVGNSSIRWQAMRGLGIPNKVVARGPAILTDRFDARRIGPLGGQIVQRFDNGQRFDARQPGVGSCHAVGTILFPPRILRYAGGIVHLDFASRDAHVLGSVDPNPD